MELKKKLIGHVWRSRNATILISEENKELLKEKGADVFEEVKKPKRTKYKGIKEDKPQDDDISTESAE